MTDDLNNRFFVLPYTLLGRTRFRVIDAHDSDADAKSGVNDFATKDEAEAICQQRNAQKH